MLWVAYVIAGFAASLVAHAIYVRLAPSTNRPISFLVTGSAMALIPLAAAAQRFGLLSTEVLATAATYGFLCELYLFLFSSSLSSVSMNLLVRLRSLDMSDDELAENYSGEGMVQARIERLLATGMLRRTQGEQAALTPRGREFLSSMERLGRLFRHRRG